MRVLSLKGPVVSEKFGGPVEAVENVVGIESFTSFVELKTNLDANHVPEERN
jgi:hypothetical protein